MRVAVINDYHHVAQEAADWSRLTGLEVSFHGQVSDAEAPALLSDCDIVVTSREETRFDTALLAKLPRLRLLVTHGMNNAALDLPALAARGVTVCGTGYGFTMATVELAWGLILSLVKQIPAEDRAIREGGWGAALSGGLTGKVLGLVGLGTLGGDMARLGHAFGMEVIAWSENLTEARCAEVGARHVPRRTLFAEADIVSIHTRYSGRTHGLVGAAEIGAMRPHALLINTSRGPVVDEAALVAALREKRIGGAGLDVYDTEPLPTGHPLRALPNTVLTAHVGGRTRENFLVRYREALEDVEAFLAGHPVRVLVGGDGVSNGP